MCGRFHCTGSSGISRSEVPAYLLVPCDPVSGEFLDHVCRAHRLYKEHRCSCCGEGFGKACREQTSSIVAKVSLLASLVLSRNVQNFVPTPSNYVR